MLYALDTEFMEDGSTIELLSIGLVAEDGRELYLENWHADLAKADPWVQEYVLPHLHLYEQTCSDDGHKCPLHALSGMGRIIYQWMCDKSPVFWGYYSAYDWVVVCQLFGAMINLPKNWPMYCHDLRSWLDLHHFSYVKQPDDMPHHALRDARWIMQTLKKYRSYQPC